jgi:hypothetical protein
LGAFGGLILTNKGRNLQLKAQTGKPLNFTRIALGDGTLGGTSILDLNALRNERKSLNITKLKVLGDGKVVVGGVFSNSDITTGFYWREIGLFAMDPDIGEILYSYGNSGNNAEFIPAGGGADIVEKTIDLITIVGNAANVSATIEQSLVFAQSAFSNVKVGAATISADSPDDTLELVAGNAVTLIPDATNDRVTIAVPNATSSAPGAMSAADKAKLDGIQSGAEPNQNAFSNVKVGTTTIAADSKTDTLELVAGQNIVLTPDAANDKVTIDVTGVAPSSHTHPFSDITNKPTTVDGYGITDAVKTSDVVTSPAPNKILKLDANGKLPTSITGNADGNAATASKLQTARTISLTGDATGSTSFDGSSNASIAVTLANSGVTPGTYPKVTVDSKGRVTGGQSLSPADIPNLDWSKITSGKPTTLAGYGITDAIPANQKGAANGVASLDGSAKVPTSQLPSASTSTPGIVQLVDSVSSTSTTQAPTANAVKQANDNANNRVSKNGDTMTGVLSIQRQGDGVELLKFNSERPWSFYQKGTGASTALELKSSNSDKSLLISSANGDPTLEVRVSDTPSNKKVTVFSGLDVNGTITTNGNIVWHAGNDGAGSGLDADTVDGKQASDFVWKTEKGAPNGVATLDASGKVPASQLNISMTGSAITITDSGGYYTSGNVEGALQEIGQKQNDLEIFYWMGAI